MIRVIKILIILFSLPSICVGQSLQCIYEELALKAYEEKDFVKSKAYSDSTLAQCPELFENAYVWYVRGHVLWNIFKVVDNRAPTSSAREESLEAFYRSILLDSANHDYDSASKASIDNIAVTYWNDIVHTMDTNSFDKAIVFYNKFSKAKKIAIPEYDLSQNNMVFYRALGDVYRQKYNNNKKRFSDFIDLSIETYKKVLKIDSMDYSTNYNLGVIYHNLGVDLILTEIDYVEDIELLMLFQEKTVEYFSSALPYLQNAYLMQPNNQQVVQGMAAVYLSLHDEEKHLMYMSVLKDLQKSENESKPNIESYPAWDASVKYSTGDIVVFSGYIYKAITVSTGVTPNSSSADWLKINE